MTSLTPAEVRQPQNLAFIRAERQRAIAGLTSRFVTHPWPVNFLLIVSPLVTWIWGGALIIVIGGLIALWPIPAVVRRRSPAFAGTPTPAPPPRPRSPRASRSSVETLGARRGLTWIS